MAGKEDEPELPDDAAADATRRPDVRLEEIAAQLRELATAKDRLQGLLDAVLVIGPDRHTVYLDAEPGLPLAVDIDQDRPDHVRPDHVRSVPAGATVLFFTDGLVEHPDRSIDQGLAELAGLAADRAHLPLDDFVRHLADHHPGDGHDDIALLALRTPRD
ncbi:SpoIIE family protein phosphatase [Streptomyces caeruleatus]|uniref:PPM-type phosphatase domain-containing protein n=1 Tax=Streptomyces caeruleatus TaxID=661399 RepID=A0A101U714_9ACTN|nr:hypothetical protein AQJ67_07415 [Streptomyces caeruleatus]